MDSRAERVVLGRCSAVVSLHFSPPHPLAEIFSSPRRPAETAAVQVHLMCSSSAALGMEGEADHKENLMEDERGRASDGENKFLQLCFGLCCRSLLHHNHVSFRHVCGEEPGI